MNATKTRKPRTINKQMQDQGRTIHEAIEAGDYYGIRTPTNWQGRPTYEGGVGTYGFEPPSCRSPEEVLEVARKVFGRDIKPGMVFDVYRIVGGMIGAYHIERCGTITA